MGVTLGLTDYRTTYRSHLTASRTVTVFRFLNPEDRTYTSS